MTRAARIAAVVTLLFSAPVSGQARDENWKQCSPDDVSPALRIRACTAIIQSGRETPRNLAIAFYNRAIADYDRAIQLHPSDAQAFNNRGVAYRAKGENERAIADYDEAIRLNPSFATASYNRGIVYRTKGDNDRAIADYDQAIRLNPSDAEVFNNRGFAYRAKGDNDRARADYDQAIRLNPSFALAFRNRGHVEYLRQEWTSSLGDFERLIELRPADQDYPQIRIWLLRARLGQRQSATAALAEFMKRRKPGAARDWPGMIESFLAGTIPESEFLKSPETARDAKTHNEETCEAYFYAGTVRLLNQDRLVAADYFRKALATNVKTFEEYESAAAELQALGTGVFVQLQ
jgi:lipoprotein NlpI